MRAVHGSQCKKWSSLSASVGSIAFVGVRFSKGNSNEHQQIHTNSTISRFFPVCLRKDCLYFELKEDLCQILLSLGRHHYRIVTSNTITNKIVCALVH